jgi:F-type H+-transporting ATPase subunit b
LKRALLPLLIVVLLVAAAPAWAKEKHEAAAELRTLLWKSANFLILAAALVYVIRKKGVPFFAARTASIRHGLDEAARMTKEAEARYAETERRLANIGAEIEALREQARKEAAAEGERIRQELQRDMAAIQSRTEQEIASAAKAAQQELRAHAAELALSLAEGKIRERMTPEAEGALVGAMVRDLEARAGAPARIS